jgi:hypothetical protein
MKNHERERELNRRAVGSLMNLYKGLRLPANSLHDRVVSRRAMKIAVEYIRKVDPAAYSDLCRKHVEAEIANW